MTALLAAVAAALVLAPAALASPQGSPEPRSPCAHGSPAGLCTSDGVVVVPEPPGSSCPAGGIKLTVGDQPPQFVCNGVSGPQGPAGPQGTTGLPGQQGAPGANGTNGVNGTNGAGGANGTTTTTSAGGCTIQRSVRLVLPRRFRSFRSVRLAIDASGQRVLRVHNQRYIEVDMRDRACGTHVLVVRKRGVRALIRVWLFRRDGTIESHTLR
jgi:hypothetical protein